MDYKILEDYAYTNGFDPDELMNDFHFSSKKEQKALYNHIMQSGGFTKKRKEMWQDGGTPQGGQDEISQLIQAYAQISGTSPEEIMQQLQSLPQEQQQAALQQMAQAVQQGAGSAGEQENTQEQGVEEPVAQLGYDHRSLMGYRDDSPYKNASSNLIKSNLIDMSYTGKDLIGVSDTGDTKVMPAYSGQHKFDGSSVTEKPIYAQTAPKLGGTDFSSQLASLDRQLAQVEAKRKAANDSLKNSKLSAQKRAEQLAVSKEYDKVSKQIQQARLEAETAIKSTSSIFAEKDYISNFRNRISGGSYFNDVAKSVRDKIDKVSKLTNELSTILPENYTFKAGSGNAYVATKKKSGLVTAPIVATPSTITVPGKPTPALTPSNAKADVASTPSNKRPAYSSTSKQAPRVSGNKYLPPTTNKEEWVGEWEKFLVKEGVIDGDHNYTVDEIDNYVADYALANPEQYKNNPYVKEDQLGVLLSDGTYGKVHESFRPPSARTDFGNIDTLAPKTLPERLLKTSLDVPAGSPSPLQQRLDDTLGNVDIPTSPENTGVLGSNPRYKIKTGNLANSIINATKVANAFTPQDLPYMQEVDARLANPALLDPRTGIQAINDQYNNVTANINSNSTTGQAVLAGLSGRQSKDLESYINDIQAKNQQITYQGDVNRAELYNKLVAGKNSANAEYYNTYLQDKAQKDANIDTALTATQTLANNAQKVENAFQEFKTFNPNVTDVTNPLQGLFGTKTVEYDKAGQDARLQAERKSLLLGGLTTEQIQALSPEELQAFLTKFKTSSSSI